VSLLQTPDFRNHFERLKAATLNKFTSGTIPEWICKHTFINGDPFSFKDHEYQEKILRDESQEVVIIKPSQVGISELSCRLALALCAVLRGYTIAYTLPTAGFASTFMRTRVDPVIQGSSYLADLLHTTTDNAEVKRIGDSYLYLKGSQSSNAPISIPCDHLFHDELDFSDMDVISQYQSRLTHSKYKRKHKLSTPTIPKRGIDREFASSRRHYSLVKCNHCNHSFVPDYFDHVKIPGSETLELRSIKKEMLPKLRYTEAYVECPACKKKPSLQPRHREWVCENPSESFTASGYQITPFDAPNIITPGYLIEASTQYKRYTDFENFGLGRPAEDKESTLSRTDLEPLLIETQGIGYGSYVMGLDMGLLCHCFIGFCTHDGFLILVHSEVIPVHLVRQRRKELAVQYRVRMTVVDSMPYLETVIAMQAEDKNLFGSVYVRQKGLEMYMVKDQDEDAEKGKGEVRQVNINRDKVLDALMELIRSRLILKVTDENDEAWMTQMCDMKRMREWTVDQELSFIWKKSEEGNDHFHHALIYTWVASQMLGVSNNALMLPFLMQKIKLAPAPSGWDRTMFGGQG